MRYFIAFLLPPLAVALCGFKPLSFILSIILTLFAWLPGVIHALFVVHNHNADVRNHRLVREIRRNR